MNPNLTDLSCFVAAMKHGNFRRAARSVLLSPAAFGQRIRSLESDLGETLFERTTRRVTPTIASHRLLPHARQMLKAAELCQAVARGEEQLGPGEIVMGTRYELGLSWILPMLPMLESIFPGLRIHLYFGSGDDLVHRIRSGYIDCAVTSTRINDPAIASATLHEERYVLCGCAELMKENPVVEVDDLAAHSLIDTNDDLPLFRYWLQTVGDVDVRLMRSVRRGGTIAAIREFIRLGEGVGVLPEYFVREDLERGVLVPLLPEVVPEVDHFRLLFLDRDPRAPYYRQIAEKMRSEPLQ